MTLTDWMDIKQKLKMELQGVTRSFVRIGYALRKIDDQKLYEQDGYKSIAEFAKGEYGLEASTVSRFMSINREYSIDGYSEHLREEYIEMKRSQLEEMLMLPEKDREMIRPETPREDIRNLKKFNKTEPAAGVADDIHKLIEMFYKENPDVLNAVFSSDDNLEHLIEIVNPSGNRSFRKGMFFMMMYEDKIMIKKFPDMRENMNWQQFFEITKEIFGWAAGPDTWKNYFEGENNGQEPMGGTERESNVAAGSGINGNETAVCGSSGADGERTGREAENRTGTDTESTSGERASDDGSIGGTGEDIRTSKGDNAGAGERNGRTGETITDRTTTDDTATVAAVEEIPKDERTENIAEVLPEGYEEKPATTVPKESTKTEIAPAQKLASDFVSTKCGAVSESVENEQIPGQMEVKDYPELLPEGYEEKPEEVISPYLTRKQFFDRLSEAQGSLYMAAVMDETLKKMKGTSYAVLLTYNFWERIWSVEVDENGNRIEEG